MPELTDTSSENVRMIVYVAFNPGRVATWSTSLSVDSGFDTPKAKERLIIHR